MAKTNTIIQTFTFAENIAVRSMLDANGSPWFVAADVCKALEIKNVTDAMKRLDDDEKMTLDNTEGRAGNGAQEFNIINESGLYSLILTSRKAEAKRFKKWVTAEVLPTIRKTGSYGVGQATVEAPKAPVALEYKPLNPQQQEKLAKAVQSRAASARTTTMKIYRELRDVFEVGSWKEIPADQYTQAKALVKSMVLEGELMPRPTMMVAQPAPQQQETIAIPVSDWFAICNIIRSINEQVRDRLDNYRYNTIEPKLAVDINRAVGMIYTHTFRAFGR